MDGNKTLPSPGDTPPLASDPASPTNSRKRQRTRSMESAQSSASASASAKRSVADHDADSIDAYMDAQGANQIEPFDPQPIPPNHKLSTIRSLKASPIQLGQTWYLVSATWWNRWVGACSGEEDKNGPLYEHQIGPVDNADLLDELGHLKHSLIEGINVEYLPEPAWNQLIQWYGHPSIHLPRKAISRGVYNEISLELHPPRFRVLKLAKSVLSPALAGPSHPYATVSSQDTVSHLIQSLAQALTSEPITVLFRVWKVEPAGDAFNRVEFPATELSSSQAKLLEQSTQTVDNALLVSDDAFVVEFQENNEWLVDAANLPVDRPTAPAPGPLFGSGTGFFDKIESSSVFRSKENNYRMGFSNSFTSTRLERKVEPGTLGLGNMGNTCFMNSALQCLAHLQELMEYFLSGVYKDELNPDNPLGMHGAIAEAFGSLLEKIWASNSVSTSYSPREFKVQLQHFAPQFHGYQQHDSQELIAFLLDGLHEDLNRVLQKPYVEKPDWEGGGDLELIQLAQTSWDGYKKRNDSVIVDLFQGQYQSTLVCPECEKVSITFDPFMYLTLPLPVVKKWRHKIHYIPWDRQKSHQMVFVEIGCDASFRDLRNLLGRWMDVNPDNLLTMEIFQHKFYKNLDDNVMCTDMADSDVIVCYELPCHAQQSRTYKRADGDPILIPLYFCDVQSTTVTRTGYMQSSRLPLFGYPLILPLPQEAATTKEDVYRAVTWCLGRWSCSAGELFRQREEDVSAEDKPEGGVEQVPSEGDITEETRDDIDEDHNAVTSENNSPTSDPLSPWRGLQPKDDIFEMKLLASQSEDFVSAFIGYNSPRYTTWESRADDETLVTRGDAMVLEFDEHMKAYYLGDHPPYDKWEPFYHPEYQEAKKADSTKKSKGISLQDCLDEFTKEEKLGEDDLWYCPRCRKHQQATKRFDLWKVPDILVVHLKRFSNSRILRDKIDALVEFPVAGLDLGPLVGERAAAERLAKEGMDTPELQLNFQEDIVYDLFAVDEHIGGLGGGHYRAYAQNHMNQKWYHFDDSFVTEAQAADSVNANAYVLFYRRRSSDPLGGPTYRKVEEAKSRPSVQNMDIQLPTPPDEQHDTDSYNLGDPPLHHHSSLHSAVGDNMQYHDDSIPRPVSTRFRTDRFRPVSPSSSNEAEPDDTDLELEDEDWAGDHPSRRGLSPNDSWAGSGPIDSGLASPSDSSIVEMGASDSINSNIDDEIPDLVPEDNS